MALFGSYFISPTGAAINRAWSIAERRAGEYQKLRRHGLKLAYWPGDGNSSSEGADIDWDWVKSLQNERIGELRIDEPIRQKENLRIIFFKANKIIQGDPMPRIWLMTVYQKKQNDFSKFEIKAWKAMKELIIQRRYGGDHSA